MLPSTVVIVRIAFLLILILPTQSISGQAVSAIDSLHNLLATAPSNDSLRLWWQYQLGLAYLPQQEQRSDSLATELITSAQSLDWKRGLAWGYHLQAISLRQSDQLEAALVSAERAYSAADSIQDHSLLALTSQLAAGLLEKQERWAEAIRYYRLALPHVRKGQDSLLVADLYHQLGRMYFHQQEWTPSLGMFQRALALRRNGGDLHGLGATALELGLVYLRQGRYEQALPYINQSLNYRRTVQDDRGVLTSLTYLGDVQRRLGNFIVAISHYREALRLAQALALPSEQTELLSRLVDVNATLESYDVALAYARQRRQLGDSLLQNQVATLQNQLENERQDRQLAELKYQAEVRALWFKVIVVGIPFLLLFIITLLLFARYRHRQPPAQLVEPPELSPNRMQRLLNHFLATWPANGYVSSSRRIAIQKAGQELLVQLANDNHADASKKEEDFSPSEEDPMSDLSSAPPEPTTELTETAELARDTADEVESPVAPPIIPPVDAPVSVTHNEATTQLTPLILLIDNSYELRKYLTVTIGPDFRFLEAFDGVSAIRLATEQPPDLIICAGSLPDMNSGTLCRLLRKETTRRLPVVLLVDQPPDAATQLEADVVLTKPVNVAALRSYVHRLLKAFPR